jgi:hypothetical protein
MQDLKNLAQDIRMSIQKSKNDAPAASSNGKAKAPAKKK